MRIADDACIEGSLADAAADRRSRHGLAAAGAGANRRVGAYNSTRLPDVDSRERCAKSSTSGDHVRARVALPGNDDFTVKRPIDEAHKLPAIGEAVELAWAPEHCRAFAREDEAL